MYIPTIKISKELKKNEDENNISLCIRVATPVDVPWCRKRYLVIMLNITHTTFFLSYFFAVPDYFFKIIITGSNIFRLYFCIHIL